MREETAEKARRLRELHHGNELLVLPNVWDALGAKLLASEGFPAVATASAAIAWSAGRHDGEMTGFDEMLHAVARIASSVDVPVTADIERGYGAGPEAVAANVRRLIDAGVVGINIEDGVVEGGDLVERDTQCARIAAARSAADAAGVSMVINARTDVFLRGEVAGSRADLKEALDRLTSYVRAGADCVYPITLEDPDALSRVAAATGAPVNVLASATLPPADALRAAGVARVSLGPGLLKIAFGEVRRAARLLRDTRDWGAVLSGAPGSHDVAAVVDTRGWRAKD